MRLTLSLSFRERRLVPDICEDAPDLQADVRSEVEVWCSGRSLLWKSSLRLPTCRRQTVLKRDDRRSEASRFLFSCTCTILCFVPGMSLGLSMVKDSLGRWVGLGARHMPFDRGKRSDSVKIGKSKKMVLIKQGSMKKKGSRKKRDSPSTSGLGGAMEVAGEREVLADQDDDGDFWGLEKSKIDLTLVRLEASLGVMGQVKLLVVGLFLSGCLVAFMLLRLLVELIDKGSALRFYVWLFHSLNGALLGLFLPIFALVESRSSVVDIVIGLLVKAFQKSTLAELAKFIGSFLMGHWLLRFEKASKCSGYSPHSICFSFKVQMVRWCFFVKGRLSPGSWLVCNGGGGPQFWFD